MTIKWSIFIFHKNKENITFGGKRAVGSESSQKGAGAMGLQRLVSTGLFDTLVGRQAFLKDNNCFK